MALDSLLRRLQSDSDTSDTSCNVSDVSREPAWIKADTPDTSDTSQITNVQVKKQFISNVSTKKESPCVLVEADSGKASDLEKIQAWLFRIGEAEEDHHLVMDRCRSDPEVMAYYLRHAQGEFVKPASVVSDSLNVKIGNKEAELRIIRSWLVNGGRPQQDFLFRLITEKCENDSDARAHFLQEALAAEARKQSVVNEKVVPLSDHDDRVKCGDCKHLSGGHCKEWKQTNPGNQRYKPMKDVLRRCGVFQRKE